LFLCLFFDEDGEKVEEEVLEEREDKEKKRD
jgi:hypothetical protein